MTDNQFIQELESIMERLNIIDHHLIDRKRKQNCNARKQSIDFCIEEVETAIHRLEDAQMEIKLEQI